MKRKEALEVLVVQEENKHLLEKYQQHITVFLDEEKDMDELIDIIQKVHDLEFVQYVDFICDYDVWP